MGSLLLVYSKPDSDEEQKKKKSYQKSVLIQCEPTV